MAGVFQPINWEPFDKAGRLLYDGTFVLERVASIPDLPGSGGIDGPTWFEKHKADLHPVISELFTAVINRKVTAVDVFRDLQAQRRYTVLVHNEVFTQDTGGVDVVVLPTAPTHWTIDEVKGDPIVKNSALGVFTHCSNVLDLCAISCPAREFDAKELGGQGVLPFGVMFMGRRGGDSEVLDLATRFEDFLKLDADASRG
jgi:Asp-tRNA(Asn)/Glu-tRNA(Gln) amidotransferase A subunit family amidase